MTAAGKVFGYRNTCFQGAPSSLWFTSRSARNGELRSLRRRAIEAGITKDAAIAGIYPVERHVCGGKFHENGKAWEWRWLNDEQTLLSVLQREPDIDEDGTDMTDWPGERSIGGHVGCRVLLSDVGRSSGGAEAIYETAPVEEERP